MYAIQPTLGWCRAMILIPKNGFWFILLTHFKQKSRLDALWVAIGATCSCLWCAGTGFHIQQTFGNHMFSLNALSPRKLPRRMAARQRWLCWKWQDGGNAGIEWTFSAMGIFLSAMSSRTGEVDSSLKSWIIENVKQLAFDSLHCQKLAVGLIARSEGVIGNHKWQSELAELLDLEERESSLFARLEDAIKICKLQG